MGRYSEWKELKEHELGYSTTPPNIPRVIDGKIGNELKTDAGRTSKERAGESGESRFRDSVDRFKTKISEMPVPRSQESRKHGFGHLGHSTFDERLPEKAGETPTLSNGIPVGSLRGQFGENTDFQQQSLDQLATAGDDAGGYETKVMKVLDTIPVNALAKLWPSINSNVQNRVTGANQSKGRQMQMGAKKAGATGMQQFGKVNAPVAPAPVGPTMLPTV